MSVYIKGMEMPKNCNECRFLDEYGDYPLCIITNEQRGYNFRTREERMPHCPLVPVPPHGDLVDKQRMAETNEQHYKIYEGYPIADYARQVVLRILDQAPTVIPASEEVYASGYDTAGNYHWVGTKSGEHIILADKEET